MNIVVVLYSSSSSYQQYLPCATNSSLSEMYLFFILNLLFCWIFFSPLMSNLPYFVSWQILRSMFLSKFAYLCLKVMLCKLSYLSLNVGIIFFGHTVSCHIFLYKSYIFLFKLLQYIFFVSCHFFFVSCYCFCKIIYQSIQVVISFFVNCHISCCFT